jgi:hypothetical protein
MWDYIELAIDTMDELRGAPPLHSGTPRAFPTQTHRLPRETVAVRLCPKCGEIGAASPALCFRPRYMHLKRNMVHTKTSDQQTMPVQNGE